MDKFSQSQIEFLACIGVRVENKGDNQAVYNDRADQLELRLSRVITGLAEIVSTCNGAERPPWCTDETFLRVKINPILIENSEYCIGNEKHCHFLELAWNHNTNHHYCPIINEFYMGAKTCILRPDACRKLEVE